MLRHGVSDDGCSYLSRDKIIEATAKINSRIHLVAGGFHLVVAQDEEIARISSILHDTYNVAYIASGHCAGEPTFAALRKAFGAHYLYAGLGTSFALGWTLAPIAENPSPETGLDKFDLVSYRALHAKSDEQGDPLLVDTR